MIIHRFYYYLFVNIQMWLDKIVCWNIIPTFIIIRPQKCHCLLKNEIVSTYVGYLTLALHNFRWQRHGWRSKLVNMFIPTFVDYMSIRHVTNSIIFSFIFVNTWFDLPWIWNNVNKFTSFFVFQNEEMDHRSIYAFEYLLLI